MERRGRVYELLSNFPSHPFFLLRISRYLICPLKADKCVAWSLKYGISDADDPFLSPSVVAREAALEERVVGGFDSPIFSEFAAGPNANEGGGSRPGIRGGGLERCENSRKGDPSVP